MLVAQSCLTLCDSIDCSSPGFSVHGILQARILEWVAILFSRGSSQSRDWTLVSCIAGRFFTVWATREDLYDKRDFAKVIEVRLLRWGDYFAFTRCFHYNHRVFIRGEVEIREGIGSGTRKGRSWSDGRKEQWMRTWRWSPEARRKLVFWLSSWNPLISWLQPIEAHFQDSKRWHLSMGRGVWRLQSMGLQSPTQLKRLSVHAHTSLKFAATCYSSNRKLMHMQSPVK